ncbi:MAG TPA: GAF domain-containing sensor histidine kinase [Ramlibacter sp.]|nr:GAF domain-containing sensor histidine kinase [Ramlibacter sp.]
MTSPTLQEEIDAVSAMDTVSRILEVVCRTTGMGFAAVARVTESRWVCCSVRDEIDFGLKPGGELALESTICNEIRQSGSAVVIDHVAQDPAWYGHPTPARYGFQSYISMPIVRRDGGFWGTLCAIDPRPAVLRTPQVLGMFELFAQLIAFHLDSDERLRISESALLDARQTARLREEFIAVIGHDLRNPLQTLGTGVDILARAPERGTAMLPVLRNSVRRMSALVENLLDFARGRLGGGLVLALRREEDLRQDLQDVVDELTTAWPGRPIAYEADLSGPVACDRTRIAQLMSNLLANALKYGDPEQPVRVEARTAGGALEIRVANGGTPIPEEVRARLFEPYFRGAAQATDREGLGLGLYIVSEIARAHGGTVEVGSNAQETCFTFRMRPPA